MTEWPDDDPTLPPPSRWTSAVANVIAVMLITIVLSGLLAMCDHYVRLAP